MSGQNETKVDFILKNFSCHGLVNVIFFTSESFISFCEYTKIFVLPQTTCKYDRHEVCCESKLLISVNVYVSNPYKSTLATLVRFSFRKSPRPHVPRPHVPTSPRPSPRVPRPKHASHVPVPKSPSHF